ncbi:dihydrolipoamide acetyltransferase family protein [Runella slithyformis]|uniref:Dihydrolipoamide acetyltransferase component of pyruvate dehydrogenase complex n=1 Tax=Runella slithyformis (strain ATCC 29530 / DSM 19594 / LMG 11500 / NCIMB 11436 / LSU 4) TaxID=761193 RepID=A0A7U4E8S5_RUNSL|nr:dihydrolipoamide acetyltransferase family protein [Runella slithyformis]AEI51658.1 Dihydrolipoyllysine-residue succinyltransferase [Runella slithyformis DSM 19594]
MAIVEMVMPRMGESVMECTVISILKKVGDRVESDDSVLEVATDKVDTEVPSPYSGTIKEILVQEGDVVAIGNVVIRIDTETTVHQNGSPAPVAILPEEAAAAELETQFQALAAPSVPPAAAPETMPLSGRFYSPLVLNIAQTEGISRQELDQIAGTGTDSRVTKKDILGYLEQKKHTPAGAGLASAQNISSHADAASSVSQSPSSISSRKSGIEIIPMDRMRRVIAERMRESQRISAHVTSFVETDMTNVVLWRNKIKDDFKKQTGEGITFTPILIEAVVKAIKDFPLINISVEGENILKKRDINVGMAVALPNGNLIVPIIHNADQYSLIGLAKKVNELANRARQNKLTPDDLAGGTYTVSNIGSFGNIMGTPIILQPQVAIMAFGAIQKRPVVIETPQGDVIGVRSMMYISHSYDHRVVDGALGGMFVKRVSDYLEKFDLNRSPF